MRIQPQFRFFSFDGFVVDVEGREIRDPRGSVRKLVGKPFDVLVFLAANHQRFVSTEELLAEFWSGQDQDDEDGSDPQNVYKAISKIRLALGNPSCIITERYRGARIKGPVTFSPEADSLGPSEPWRRFPWIYAGAFAFLFIVVLFGFFILRPVSGPSVINGSPITHTGTLKYAPIIAYGGGIYFTELAFGQYRIVKMDLISNEMSVVSTDVANPYLCDIAPDRKALLLRSVVSAFDDYGPLFIQKFDSRVPESLPIIAFDGAWSPDGKTLAYCRGPEVALFNLSSKTGKTIARVRGYAWWPRWAPGGKRIRFTVSDSQTQLTSIWDIRADGNGLRQIFKPEDRWFHAGAGSWTGDGRYFLFQVGPLRDSKLWVLDEGLMAMFRKRNPFQLSSEISLRGPALLDGRTILARSQMNRGEIRKVDPANGAQTDLPIQGISDITTYSPDGKWMSYCISDQEQSLWLSKADGSSPRMLIGPPLQCAFPQWSRDGDRIALTTRRSDDQWKITIISVKTGKFERLALISSNALHPNWSPDGKELLFGTIPTLEENTYLYKVDLATHHISVVEGSQGLFTPAWSPNGRYIAALKKDSYQLMMFDKTTGHWSSLAGSRFGYPTWSPDSHYIYSFHNDSTGPRFYRVDVASNSVKEILYLPGFHLLDRWIGLHPDGSLLIAKNIGIQEVFALHLDRVLTNATSAPRP